MADQLQCPGCDARFRLRINEAAPKRADLACPRCGAAIPLHRRTSTANDAGPTGPAATTSRDPESTTDTSRPPDRSPTVEQLDPSTVFGRPTPPPPAGVDERSGLEVGTAGGPSTSNDRPESTDTNPPGSKSSTTATPRLPEDDRPDDVRPLARSLLEKLEKRRSRNTTSVETSNPPDVNPVAQSETVGSSTAEDDDKQETTDSDLDSSTWFDDDSIEDAVETAAADALIVDKSSMAHERLRSPDSSPDPDSEADTDTEAKSESRSQGSFLRQLPWATGRAMKVRGLRFPFETETETETKTETETESESESEPKPEPEPETESETNPRPPLTVAIPDGADAQLRPADNPMPDTTYRLKIGGRIYGDLDFDALISLFRRGIWVVADEIAEDDGPWRPIESHPVYERVRHAIADGVTSLLLMHGNLVDEQPADPGAAAGPPPRPPAASGSTPAQRTPAVSPPEPPPTPPRTAQPDAEPAAEPSEEDESSDDASEVSATIRFDGPVVPWAIALVAAGFAGATFAFFAFVDTEPSSAPAEHGATAEPAEPTESTDAESGALPHPDAELRMSAVDEATGRIDDATDITAVDLVDRATDRGQYQRARELAARAYHQTSDTDELRRAFDRAVANDPALHHTPRTMRPDEDADDLEPITEGASITLRFTDDGRDRYAYKVARDDWPDGWRVEVAAYQLCEILPCDLRIPVNEPARISRDDFEELYERNETASSRAYADRRFDELLWHNQSGPDGRERDYLYGTLKEWIPHYTRWPIEHIDTWQPWLDVTGDPSILDDQGADDYLRRLDSVYDGQFLHGLRRETDGYSARHLARQISNLHVFDYLTTNFDRYSNIEDYYGVNTHFADGYFVPIDNSAAFQFVELRVPLMDERIRSVSRFSRSLVDAIRLMRPEVVEPALFPGANDRERRRLDIFWQQRDKFLAYVDGLVDEYGEEAVYAFE